MALLPEHVPKKVSEDKIKTPGIYPLGLYVCEKGNFKYTEIIIKSFTFNFKSRKSMECNAAFEDFVSNCNTDIEVKAALEPLTLYKWVLTTPNGNEYYGEQTTDAEGYMNIPVEDLPAGLLNQYGGTYFLQFFDTPYQCRKVNFFIGKEYDAISFTVKAGNNQKPNLGCELP